MKTSPIEVSIIDYCGSDLSVVNAARVSFHKKSSFDPDGFIQDKDVKLIKYLANHKHTSPFNHAFISMRIKAPIFVARQLVKHKFMPWNEVSRRYVDEEPEFYFPEYWRKKADNVKQGSGDEPVELMQLKDAITGEPWTTEVPNAAYLQTEESLRFYNSLLKNEVCPEQARMVLPLNTMTEWIWSGTLGAWADMLKLRLDPHTQRETRDVAQEVYERIQPLFPVSIGALLNAK